MTLVDFNTEQLVTLCLSGNQKAQLELYNRYYHAMYNTSFRIVNNSFEAEDVMQESFILAFTKLSTLKEGKIFGSWLKRIVINNSITAYNKNHKQKDVALDDVLYKVEKGDDQQGMHIDKDYEMQKAKQILDEIKQLKPNYKVVLTLHLIEGYDYEEIGEIMNVSYANCRTMISRAKNSLRTRLELLN